MWKDDLDTIFASLSLSPVQEKIGFKCSQLQRDALLLIMKQKQDPLTYINRIPVKYEDVNTLIAGGWLNDEIINAYTSLICKTYPDVFIHNTFFYSRLASGGYRYDNVKRWTKRVRLNEYRKIVIPINFNNSHWACVVVDMKQGKITGLDSLMSKARLKETTLTIKRYLADEFNDKNFPNKVFAVEDTFSCPQQLDGSSCGVFVCAFCYHVATGGRYSVSNGGKQSIYL